MRRVVVIVVLLIALSLACSRPSGPDQKAERRREMVVDTLDGGD